MMKMISIILCYLSRRPIPEKRLSSNPRAFRVCRQPECNRENSLMKLPTSNTSLVNNLKFFLQIKRNFLIRATKNEGENIIKKKKIQKFGETTRLNK